MVQKLDDLGYRNLERNKVSALRIFFGDFESIVVINEDSKNEMNEYQYVMTFCV
jgi:hypothetical protein